MKICGINRHRKDTDGVGITSLVALPGCPLSCKYCINKELLTQTDRIITMQEEELVEKLSIDHSYFVYTNGGITFGGGEPLLQWESLARFAKLCPKEWNLTIETSLNVPEEYLRPLLQFPFSFIVDTKSMDSKVYESYTGETNRTVHKNLQLIKELVSPECYAIKVPIIPEYADEISQQYSIEQLVLMGFDRETIVPFTYLQL
ncbi:radical SAM protein [Anaerosporobacter faecicola]|uniref:radical SAM protein n=1 Tax=Anaerosporobacter faecicola TaxID=2718714 RepID=UPI00143C3E20|nr:radical SAM protein [Anaerosporobacter faecicola]